MVARPDAQIIFLKQTRLGQNDLKRAAVQDRAMGCVVESGDDLSSFLVYTTMPEGPVLVTNSTRFVFSS